MSLANDSTLCTNHWRPTEHGVLVPVVPVSQCDQHLRSPCGGVYQIDRQYPVHKGPLKLSGLPELKGT